MADALSRRAAIGSGLALMSAASARADQAARAWDFTFTSIEDGTLPLAAWRGRVLLVANTASFCGFTYQYEGLEKLHAELEPRGLTVVGVPSTDFFQESRDNKTVQQFCEATFGVRFPMAGITRVRGSAAHPFYRWVRAERSWQPTWNFCKVLIGRDGAIAGTYGSFNEPSGRTLRGAIDQALAAQV